MFILAKNLYGSVSVRNHDYIMPLPAAIKSWSGVFDTISPKGPAAALFPPSGRNPLPSVLRRSSMMLLGPPVNVFSVPTFRFLPAGSLLSLLPFLPFGNSSSFLRGRRSFTGKS